MLLELLDVEAQLLNTEHKMLCAMQSCNPATLPANSYASTA